MRIVIDLQGAQTESRFRGIGRYILSFAKAVARNRGEDEVILVLNGLLADGIDAVKREFAGLLPEQDIRTWSAPGPVREHLPDNDARRRIAEKVREAFIASLAPDIVHVASLFEGYLDDAATSIGAFDVATPVTVTLYDLIPYLNPRQYLAHNAEYRAHYLRKIEWLRNARAYLAISAHARDEGRDALQLPEDRFHNVSTAIDANFIDAVRDEARIGAVLEKLSVRQPFVLYTGGSDERKNLPRMIEAYAQLDRALRRGLQLVLAGRMSADDVERLRKHAFEHGVSRNDIVFTGYVDDDELVALYQSCRCFIFPSWHEGFGLPALEAMTCGAPVIGSGTSSIVEVIDLPEAMFDPFDTADITAKLARCLTDEAFRARLVAHGRDQAKRFSWDETARRALQVWRGIVAEGGTEAPPQSDAQRPRLALFSPLPPERSGIADYTIELLPELARHYRIDVVVDQADVDVELPADVRIVRVGDFDDAAHAYERIVYQMGNSPFHKHMPALLQRHPGVVVQHDFFLGSLLQWMELNRGDPQVWNRALYRSHGYRALAGKLRDPAAAKRDWPCSFDTVGDALGVIVHSQYSSRLLQRWYGNNENAQVVPLLRTLAPPRDQAAAKRRLGLDEDAFLVCSFGFLDHTKLNHVLLEAWEKSRLAADTTCHLVFVGENEGGDYGLRIKSMIEHLPGSERIRITGFATPAVYRDWLDAADVAVQLRTQSRGETSAAALDCMGRGIALIVNANGTMAEIDASAAVVLSDEFETESLGNALDVLRAAPFLRNMLGDKARSVIATRHDPRHCAQLYRDAIEQAYAPAKTAPHALFDALGESAWEGSDEDLCRLCRDLATTFPQPAGGRRLLLDVTATAGNGLHTGIERVVRALAGELLANDVPGIRIEPVRLVQQGGQWLYRHAHDFALQLLGAPGGVLDEDVVDPRAGDVLLGLDISGHALIEAEQSGLLQRFRTAGVRVHFMLHDLLPIRLPEVFPPGADVAHAQWLQVAARTDGAVCVSDAVAADLRTWLAQPANGAIRRDFRVQVSHHGADLDKSRSIAGTLDAVDRVLQAMHARPTFLMVGTIEPRKGYLQTLQAFGELWRRGVDANLVVIGREGWRPLPDDMRRDIPQTLRALKSSSEAGKRLFWLDDASDGTLQRVYASASCLLSASFGEGFGLPLIEAAAQGVPLCVRDLPVFREVAGDAAHYFTARTPGELADALQAWLALFAQGRHPPSSALAHKTWKQSAEHLLHLLMFPEVRDRYHSMQPARDAAPAADMAAILPVG